MIGGSTVTNEAMWTYNKESLGQAVNILPGVVWASTGAPSINSSGARAEGDIFVRGFDRFQVPLTVDGVRSLSPRRQSPRHEPLSDAGPCRGAGRQGLRVGAERTGRRRRRHQPRVAQADQGDRARGPLGHDPRRRPGLDGPVEQLRLRRHAPEGLLRAALGQHRRSGPLRPVERFLAVALFAAPGTGHVANFPYEKAAIATTRISRTGASTPRSASRRMRPTNTRSTTPISRARRMLRSAWTARSCRAISIRDRSAGTTCHEPNTPRYWTWPQWDTVEPLVAVEDAARRRVVHQDQRLL